MLVDPFPELARKTVVHIRTKTFSNTYAPFIRQTVLGLTPYFRNVVLAPDFDCDVPDGVITRHIDSQEMRRPAWPSSMAADIREVFGDVVAVVGHFGNGMRVGCPLAAALGVPALGIFGGSDINVELQSERYRDIFRGLFQDPDAYFLTVADYLADKLVEAGAPPERTLAWRRGIDLTLFRPPAWSERLAGSGPVRIVMAGRFIEVKGHEFALRAFAEAVADVPGLLLDLYGEGPLLEPMRELAGELGIAGSVVFHGQVDRDVLIQELAAAQIALLPSVRCAEGKSEGIPNVLVEAQAMAVPVVATTNGGIPETVIDGTTGLLIPERDVHALAEALRRLAANADLRQAMGEAARTHTETSFDRATQARCLAAKIQQMANRAPLRAIRDAAPAGLEAWSERPASLGIAAAPKKPKPRQRAPEAIEQRDVVRAAVVDAVAGTLPATPREVPSRPRDPAVTGHHKPVPAATGRSAEPLDQRSVTPPASVRRRRARKLTNRSAELLQKDLRAFIERPLTWPTIERPRNPLLRLKWTYIRLLSRLVFRPYLLAGGRLFSKRLARAIQLLAEQTARDTRILEQLQQDVDTVLADQAEREARILEQLQQSTMLAEQTARDSRLIEQFRQRIDALFAEQTTRDTRIVERLRESIETLAVAPPVVVQDTGPVSSVEAAPARPPGAGVVALLGAIPDAVQGMHAACCEHCPHCAIAAPWPVRPCPMDQGCLRALEREYAKRPPPVVPRASHDDAAGEPELRLGAGDLPSDGRLAFPDASFGMIEVGADLQAVQDVPTLFAELSRVLRPDGWLLLSVWPLAQGAAGARLIGGLHTPFAHRLFDPEVLAAYLGAPAAEATVLEPTALECWAEEAGLEVVASWQPGAEQHPCSLEMQVRFGAALRRIGRPAQDLAYGYAAVLRSVRRGTDVRVQPPTTSSVSVTAWKS